MRQFSISDDTPTPAFTGSAFRVAIFVEGTFDGTLKLQASPNGSSWFDVPGAALTERGMAVVDTAAPFLRFVNGGGAGAPSLTCWVGVR